MRAIVISFKQMLRQMKRDMMLTVILFVPFLTGVIFRFAIPVAERLLTDYLGLDTVLSPYYALFDLFLVLITPSMFNYVVAMVMLEEADDHIITCLSVTPLGKAGYMFSRLGITGLISFPVSLLAGLIFQLSETDALMLTGVALAGTIQGVIVALLIVALSTNKVEGMAVGKMASVFSLGALVPYFVVGKVQYLFSALPSFWIAKSMQSNNYLFLLASILFATFWMVFLYKKFKKKVTG